MQARAPDLPGLVRDLQQQRRWGRQVDQMKMTATVGLLSVDRCVWGGVGRFRRRAGGGQGFLLGCCW